MKKRILIVDDNSVNLYMMETLLKGHGYDVSTAENGREALEKARLDPPDLVISDSLMPVMDGYNLCREWKVDETLRHRPFALYTATYTDSKDEKFALDLGVDRFIIKPLEPAVLVGIIGELLEDGYRARQVESKPIEEEMEFFRQYNEILFKKLEKKMQDLEEANQSLMVSEEGYRRTFLNASDVIYTVDDDLILRSISPSVERILGYMAQDFVDRPVTEFGRRVLTSESFERAIADAAAILGGQRIASTVYEFVARDETLIYGEVSGSPLQQDGKITGFVSVARDITERKRAEEELKARDIHYKKLFSEVPGMIYQFMRKPGGRYCVPYATESIKDYFGCLPQDVREDYSPMTKVILPDDLGKVISTIESSASSMSIWRCSFRVQVPGQPMRWILGHSTPERLADDSIVWHGFITDITERKLRQMELRKSEANFQDLFNDAPVGYFEYDTQGRISRANRTYLEMLGYQPEEMVGQPVWKFMMDEQGRQQILDKLAGTLAPFRGVERLYRRKDGTTLPVLVQDRLFQDEQGGIKGIRCTAEDITERKRAGDALAESEKKFRFITEKMTDMVWTQDMNLRTVYVSPSIEAMLGFTPEERLGQDVLKQLTPESMSFVLDMMAKELALEQQGQADPERKIILELEYYHKDGSTRWLENIISGIRDDRGVLIGVHGVSRDVTKRKAAEISLRAAEEKYRSVFDNAQEGIFRATPEGRFIMANPAMAHILGYDSPEELTASITDITGQLYVESGDRKKILEAIEKQGYTKNPEIQFRKKDDSIGWVSLTKHAVRDQKGNILYHEGIIVDVTERKENVERLRKALYATVQTIAGIVETRDPYTAGHQRRVANLSGVVAKELGLSDDQIQSLQMAGIIHDVGKISVPAEILSKPTKLTDIEFSLIKSHAQSGYDILKDIEFPWPIARMVLEHHERVNGSGYPNGLTGDKLLIESKILTVADVVESMSSYRPYRPALGIDKALEEISTHKGVFYDPVVVDACIRLFHEKDYKIID